MGGLFTSESVTEGQSDKICDKVADAILDAYLEKDPTSHVDCEVIAYENHLKLKGNIISAATIDHEKTARDVIAEIGYMDPDLKFDANHCGIDVDINRELSKMPETFQKRGFPDYGVVFGYACKETPSYMPAGTEFANQLAKRLTYVRKLCIIPGLLPDGKIQVTMEYENGNPKRVDAVFISTQHRKEIRNGTLKYALNDEVISKVIPEKYIDENTKCFVDPIGDCLCGGPAVYLGATGRKIVSDTYGGYARSSGNFMAGKDALKAERSGAYMARYLAKNIVASEYADRCEVQLCYAMGLTGPVSVHIETFGTGKMSQEEFIRMIYKKEDLSLQSVIKKFQLNQPIYSNISCYGYFGENAKQMPWEQITWK